jgi:FkbH-like protein
VEKISLSQLSQEKEQVKSVKNLTPLTFLILSNVTVETCKIPLKNIFLKAGFDIQITFGSYNNIVQDSQNTANYDVTVVIWELANIIEDLFFKYFAFSDSEKNDLLQKVKAEIEMVSANLAKSPISFVTKFTSAHFYAKSEAGHAFDDLISNLNNHLAQKSSSSTYIIDIDNIYATLGFENCIDTRLFNLFKSLYTTPFYYHLGQKLATIVSRNKGKVKKVLILDCDNTLWKGIVGEDGFDGIEMSANSKKGSNFARIQYLIKGLLKRGVLLCLCSKNNFDEVQNVLENHPDMLLSFDDFLIKKVNWSSKVQNIKEIAAELNLGLDSFVFVDDSDFEVNLIKEQLPEVKVYQVPQKLHLYPELFIEILNDFYNPILTKEDLAKTESYQQEFKRKEVKAAFTDQTEYLTSLGLKLEFKRNSFADLERISQMTQKTNQFNFTTKRYTIAEIEQFMRSDNYDVLSYSVRDKYGDYGITALVILKFTDKNVEFDTFLMSCRIIGRNIEFAIIDNVLEQIDADRYDNLILRLIHTKKNIVVNEFGEKLGFKLVEENDLYKTYTREIKHYQPFGLNYISQNGSD